MDDQQWAWPYWKFGFQRDDLFTRLHDQYNTISSSISDPVAFHHDVFEISQSATTPDEFHNLLADRKEQRLRELNESLESASLEIIANPSLIGTEQWQYALQLFRTKSLDSLVRYFASYLPNDHPWQKPECSSASSSSSETGSVYDSVTHSYDGFFDDSEEEAVFVDEPLPISTSAPVHLPPSPRAMTMCSDGSAVAIHHNYIPSNLTTYRTPSFSESDSEHSRSHHDDDASQRCDPASPITSVSDMSDVASYELLSKEVMLEDEEEEIHVGQGAPQEPDDVLQLPEEIQESETPTPKPQPRAAPFFADAKPLRSHQRHRSLSPCRRPPSPSQTYTSSSPHHNRQYPQYLQRHGRLDCSPMSIRERRCRHRELATRVLKPVQEPMRSRPRIHRSWEY